MSAGDLLVFAFVLLVAGWAGMIVGYHWHRKFALRIAIAEHHFWLACEDDEKRDVVGIQVGATCATSNIIASLSLDRDIREGDRKRKAKP